MIAPDYALGPHTASLGRPVGVALLVADDVGDTIWRMSVAQPGG